jgi:hypothetical protein
MCPAARRWRRAEGSGTRLIDRALVDHLAGIHAQLACSHRLPARHRGDVEVLDAVQVGERKGEARPSLGADPLIDLDGTDGRRVARRMARSVAKGFPASGQGRQKGVGHGFRSSSPRRCTAELAMHRAVGHLRGGAWR